MKCKRGHEVPKEVSEGPAQPPPDPREHKQLSLSAGKEQRGSFKAGRDLSSGAPRPRP